MKTFDSEHHSIDFSEYVLDGNALNISGSILEQAARRVAALNERTAEQAIIHAQAEEIERLRSALQDYKDGIREYEDTNGQLGRENIKLKARLTSPEGQEPQVISSPDLSLIIREVIRSNPVARGTLLSMKIAIAVSDALQAALDKHPAPLAVPEWQPIETVPTDGQEIRGRTGNGTIIDKLRFTALGHWWWEPAGKEIYRPGVTPEVMLRDAGIVEWMPMPAPQREGGE